MLNYTQGYVNDIIAKAEIALGNAAYNRGVAAAFGQDTKRYENIYWKIKLYHNALSNYRWDVDDNCITDVERDKIIEELIRLYYREECVNHDVFPSCLNNYDLTVLLQANGFKIELDV